MSIPYIPIITTGGESAAITERENGFAFEVTHVSFGTALYVADGTETALQNQIAKVPIAGGGRILNTLSLVINVLLKDSDLNIGVSQPVDIGEIGFWNEDVLFAIYSNGSVLFRKIANCYVAAVYTVALKTLQPIDAANITVVVDESESITLAVLGEHQAAPHPHTQYKRILDATEKCKAADGVAVDDVATIGQLQEETTARELSIETLQDSQTPYYGLGFFSILTSGIYLVLVLAGETIRVVMKGGGGGGGGYTVGGGAGGDTWLTTPEGEIARALGGTGGYGGYGAEAGTFALAPPPRTLTTFNRDNLDVAHIRYQNNDAFTPTDLDPYGLGGTNNPAAPSNWRIASIGGKSGCIDVQYKNDTAAAIFVVIVVGVGGTAGDVGASVGASGVAAVSCGFLN